MKKRFIAGAVCPKCQQQDSIVLYKEHGLEFSECVHCGDKQSHSESPINQATRQFEQLIGVFKPDEKA